MNIFKQQTQGDKIMKKTKTTPKRLIGMALTISMMIIMLMTALADDHLTGLNALEVVPVNNDAYTKALADPYTEVDSGPDFYKISYEATLPTVDFTAIFTVDPYYYDPWSPNFVAGNQGPMLEWKVRRILPTSGTLYSGTASAWDLSGKIAIDLAHSLFVLSGEYEVVGRLAGHYPVNDVPQELEWMSFNIEIERFHIVKAYKEDQDGNPLKDATLQMEGESIYRGSLSYTAVSDEDGLVSFKIPYSGEGIVYTLSELTAPDGYDASDDSYEILLTSDGAYRFEGLVDLPNDALDPYEPVTFVNKKQEPDETEPVTVDVVAYKKDKDGNPLAGATLQMKGVDDESKIYKEITDAAGKVTFSVESDGVYILSELIAPAGYKGSDESHEILVKEGKAYVYDSNIEDVRPDYKPVTFVNEKEKNDTDTVTVELKAYKEDEEGNPLADATLRMKGKNDDGDPLTYDKISNGDGLVTFSVECGTYTLSEYAAPDGYNATDKTYEILVTESGAYFFDAALPNDKTPYKPVTFVNKLIPTLIKDDHFSYMQGYPDDTFGPDKNMTRAEAIVMFSRLMNKKMDLDKDYRDDSYYPDLDKKQWYANQVCYMYELGVLADYSRDGKLRGGEPVTRAEFATLAAHFDSLILTESNQFTDVADDHWAVKYINSAAEKGWIIGYTDHTFKPEAYINRAEVVTLVNRILGRKADEAYITANSKNLPRNYTDVAGHWAYLNIMEASIGHDFIKEGSDEKWTAIRK